MYKWANQAIPKEKRKVINDKILTLINSGNMQTITKEDVFNAYTGDGGLHGFKLEEFENFHAYTAAKKEVENGQFFTPPPLCEFLIECLKPKTTDLVGDLTFGMGHFFNYLPEQKNMYGTELDKKAFKVARFLYPDANLENDDIRYYHPEVKLDLIVGNPPFNLKFEVGHDVILSQLYYCMKSAELLKPGGLLGLITPSSFLADEFFDKTMIKIMDERFNFICQFDLPANAFRHLGVTHFETKILFFQLKSDHISEVPYSTDKIMLTSFTKEDANEVYEEYILPVLEAKEKVRAKILLEQASKGSRDFEFQVKKLLFDIKRHPRLKAQYPKAEGYLDKFHNQKKPDDMDYKEWDKKKLTEKKVLSYLKKIVNEQHHVEKDVIKLVKTNGGLRLKGYSHKTKLKLSRMTGPTEVSFVQLLTGVRYPFVNQSFTKLLARKQKAFQNQSRKLKSMLPQKEINHFLNDFTLTDHSTGQVIKLNDMQKDDLNKVMQKQYTILNWQQGSGKTVAGIAWYRYLLETKKVKNVFIVSAAVSINLTWDVRLKNYQEDYVKITRLSDIEKIKEGQVVIISYNLLSRYKGVKLYKKLKHYVKKQSHKVALIVDESDGMTNYSSQRTRAVLNTFKRAKYKLLTTGTTTRNNINEIYGQLELLFNNSSNMICDCPTYHKYNKDNVLEEHENPYYMKPFPAYYGNTTFKRCYSPLRATVFGIKTANQDLFNPESLSNIIEKTIITRKFEEIVGEKKYEIITHRIKQHQAEKDLYFKIMQDFHSMLHYFKTLDNPRKEAMLKIIRQIMLLIKSTSIPHMFEEYTSTLLPNKYKKIFQLIEKFANEKVAIGTTTIEAANDYYTRIQAKYPHRNVFLIKGDVGFNRRKKIIEDFEASPTGILISTQQSLESSVNIPTCDKVIIESMQWNIPRISQYFFRFIRYDSINHKEVHFVTYDQSIELNLLGLLMCKERLNEYIKTLEFKEQSEVFEEFGIDISILDSLLEKEYDKDGRVQLTWGKQKIG